MIEKISETGISDFNWEELENNNKNNKNNKNNEDLTSLYDGYDMKKAKVGEVLDATFVGLTDNDILFDANCKDYIRVPRNSDEIPFITENKPGDVLPIAITKIQTPYLIKGSINKIYEHLAHQKLKNMGNDEAVLAHIREMSPAGYNVDILLDNIKITGFMPHTLAGINKIPSDSRGELVNTTMEVMIESFSVDKGTYIVSRRKYLNTLAEDVRAELNTQDVYTGYVTGTQPFGVFVEFNGCLTGLIHKSNIHPDWQERIADIQPGTEIDFYVKEVIKKKIILTQIQRESLWDTIEKGDEIEGIVSNEIKFGVLVKLDEETNGLIHTSELEKSNKKLKEGDKVKLRIQSVDRMNRKISLNLA